MSEPYACYMIDHWCICRWYGNKCPLYALCHKEESDAEVHYTPEEWEKAPKTRAEAEAEMKGGGE